ncbi:MAG TPA: ABC transporter permease [Chthonomonadaceae bacterium]|nr:ABC transporter permease [Chthonomonadaceae bacterium]
MRSLRLPRELPTIGLIAAMCIGLAATRPAFREPSNLAAVGQSATFIGVLACGEAFIILGAGLDLSVGSIMAVSACAAAAGIAAGWNWVAAVAAGLACSLVAGAINGGLITDRLPLPLVSGLVQRLGLKLRSVPRPPILTTLATLLLFRHGVSILTRNRSYDEFGSIAPGLAWLGQPSVAIGAFAAVVAAFALVSLRARFGRWTVAMGGSEAAARLSGVPTDRVKQAGYALSGLCAGISGILTMAFNNHAQWDIGRGAELDAIAACVVGGVRITGGDGSILGAALGALLIALLQNALVLMGRPKEQYGLITGAVILAAAVLEQARLHRREREGAQT